MLDIKAVKLRSEEEIIASWKDKETIVVSVICATFNHEPYIEDAITGFLMQETDFAFEVIVHDDASTDKTPEIVKKYQLKYPKIIKPIYQTENQYSKGGFKPSYHASTLAEGYFFAWCEGDDYWCAEDKLQLQYETLYDYSDMNLCVHGSLNLFSDDRFTEHLLKESNRAIIPTSKFIIGGGGYVTTASLFVRASVVQSLPEWFFAEAPVGDYYIQILASYPYGAVYLDEVMNVYRKGAINNFSSQMANNHRKQALLREKVLKANLLCEKELNDCNLISAFGKANFWNYTFCLRNKILVDSKVKCFVTAVSLFQFRFIYYTPRTLMRLCCFLFRYASHLIKCKCSKKS